MKMIMLLMMAAEPSVPAPDVQLLDFTASYCQPCQQMLPILQRMEHDKYPVRRIDITEEHELASKFSVDRVPTLVLLVEGKEVKRFVGLTDEAELRNEMNRAARKLSDARAESALSETDHQQAAAPLLVKPGSDGIRMADASLAESPRRSIGDIYSSMLGKDASQRAFDYPEFRAQSHDDAARPLAGLKAAEAATVRVRVKGKSTKDGELLQDVGTGTIIHSATEQALILTCAHVFLNIAIENAVVEVEVFEGGKGIRHTAKLVGGDHNSDLAILKVQTSKILPSVRLTQLAPKAAKGQALASFGCNDGADPTRLDTKLVDINRYDGPSNLVCSTDPKSGRSGGGLFNSGGELIGVCSCADRKRREGLYMAHEAILGLVSHLKLQPILLKASAGSGEEAAETFEEIANGGFESAGPDSGSPKPVKVPAAVGIAKLDTPAFDEPTSPGSSVSADSADPVSFSEEEESLPDAAPLVPGGTKLAGVPPMTGESITGPEITIWIDDKTPGSEKKVIVIPHASPWMMKLLTGETLDDSPTTATAALRPVTGGKSMPPSRRSRGERSLTQIP